MADRSSNKTSPSDELRLIRQEARRTVSLDHLRYYFDRVQELRRLHADDFDLQVLISEIHEEIIDHARRLRQEDEADAARGRSNTPSSTAVATERASEAADGFDGQDLPPTVQKLDAKTWQLATYLALFFAVLLFAAFFYLIQSARRLNLTPNEVAGQTAPASKDTASKPAVQNTATNPETPNPTNPTLRLYTDLIPGTVSIDDGEAKDLKDGELVLDKLEPGRHSLKVLGRYASSAFSFDVAEKTAPRVVGMPTANNVMAVLVSTQDGKGRLVTNAEKPAVLLDGKPAGASDPEGISLDDLGTADHDLQVTEDKDRQRFVLTYTPAPALTVYVKSDPNAGTLIVMAGKDGAEVYIDNKPYRRQTERGQLRIPLKVGEYAIRLHKPGFIDPPPQTVTIKKSEESALDFKLDPVPDIATLQIKGALPGTMVYVDKELAAAIGNDGNASISTVKPGDHVVELRRDQALPKRFERSFQTGDVVVLSGPDVTLERATVDNKAAPPPAPTAETTSTPATAANNMQVEGQQVRKGGGFVPYHVPKSSGRYFFQAQTRKAGGLFKRSKLQWYAGYQDSSNFVMFILDGKKATIRETRDGHSTDLSKTSFDADTNEWVQVDLAVKPGSITARVKTPEGGWTDLGTVPSPGRDFTQDKVGFYIPGNEEVAISDFRFSGH